MLPYLSYDLGNEERLLLLVNLRISRFVWLGKLGWRGKCSWGVRLCMEVVRRVSRRRKEVCNLVDLVDLVVEERGLLRLDKMDLFAHISGVGFTEKYISYNK